MKQPKKLSHKINRAFILQGIFISLAALLSIFFATFVLEETLIKEAIKQESDYFWTKYKENKNFNLPDTQNLTAYFDTTKLPKDIQKNIPLTNGFHESENHEIVVYKTTKENKDLYLLYYRAQVDSLAMYYGLVPLTIILIFLYSILWFSYRFSRRMVSPVSWLANQVNNIDFQAKDISPIKLDDLPFETDDEIQLLADSIVNLGDRLDNFIEREGNFTRDASHELRSPLTVIRIATDMLQTEQTLPQPVLKSIQKIKRAAEDMEGLTEAFLLLAREADNALSVDKVDVNEIIYEEVERAEPFNRIKNIPINVIQESQLSINTSDKVLSVLFGNLIRNAILYTDSGSINITVTQNSVIIEDSGIGMNQEVVDKIFSPHFRANNTNSIGHGVGLTIVKRLSERFNWDVHVKSLPKEGTRIEIVLMNK